MRPIHLEYKMFTKEYRNAVYFGTFLRHRRALQVLIVVVAAVLVFVGGSFLGLWPFVEWPIYIGIAYLIWLVILLGQIERGILKYLKSENVLIGKQVNVKISEDNFIVDISDLKVHYSLPIQQMFAVFELSRMFIVYFDHENTFLIPHRAATAEQRTDLRDLFRRKLKDNFSTRFGAQLDFPKRRGFFGGGGRFGGGGPRLRR